MRMMGLESLSPRLARLAGAALAVAAVFGTALPVPAGAQQAAVVEVDAVKSEPLAQTVPVIARLVARQAGDVAARTGGPVATVKVDVGDRVKKGAVIAEENPLSRTRQVRFTPDFGTAGKPLAPGQSASVELPIGPQRDVVTVHKDAIITMNGQTFVYVAQSGMAQIRPVQTGIAVGNRFEVVGGLRAEDLVVIRGNERLQPGQSITYEGQS